MSEKLYGRWTRHDVDSAKQQGWLEGKEFCKQAVLKILKEHTIESETRDEKNWNYISESVIEEIENL